MWLLFAAVLALNIYRADTQSLTIDEAFTYINFVAPPLHQAFANYDANNHILNTLLAKLLTRHLGSSEIILRIPSLIGGAIYLFAALRLSEWFFGGGFVSLLSFAALSLNPIVLDYLSAARGYSLAMGFLFLAVWAALRRFSPENDGSGRVNSNMAVGALVALSAASNLVFVIPGLIFTVFFVCAADVHNQARRLAGMARNLAETAIPGLAVFGSIMYFPLKHASASNFYLGEASFSRSATILLERSFNFTAAAWGERLIHPLDIAAVPVILGSFALLGVLAVSSYRPPEIPWRAWLVFPAMFLGSLAVIIGLHLVAGVPYPYERTGLYFIPLITMTVLGAAYYGSSYGSRHAALRVPAWILYAFLCCAVLQYTLEFKANRYEEWTFDAGTKRVVSLLASIHKSHPGPCRLGVTWVLEPSVNYYRRRMRLNWLAPVTREGPRAGFDFYYLTSDDKAVAGALRLRIIYTDPVSQSFLAAPSR